MLSLFGFGRQESGVAALYAAIVEASRRPEFYQAGQVPDTVDGRFELLALHLVLVLQRLREANPDQMGSQIPSATTHLRYKKDADDKMAQELFDHCFAQLDLNLREMGVGDMGVGKRIKHMGQSLYGRLTAYEQPDHAALSRNLFGTWPEEPPESVTTPFLDYMQRSRVFLAGQGLEELRQGRVAFPAFEGVTA
jgi:cytochrome b pre-mRNA-processing protein 3